MVKYLKMFHCEVGTKERVLIFSWNYEASTSDFFENLKEMFFLLIAINGSWLDEYTVDYLPAKGKFSTSDIYYYFEVRFYWSLTFVIFMLFS